MSLKTLTPTTLSSDLAADALAVSFKGDLERLSL
jgi:hypothetical protein